MHRSWRLFAITAAGALAALAQAQAQPLSAPARLPGAPKPRVETPYKPVAVTVTPAPADPSYAAFRQQLAAVAKNRVHADLARLVVTHGFFWEGDAAGAFNPTARPMENLAAAIRLESGSSGGWSALAGFAAAPSAAPLPSRPNVFCAPALPEYDPVDFDQLLAATGTQAAAWRYPREPSMPMRAGPRPAGPAVDRLGPHLIRVLTNLDASTPAWALVAAPSGKTGFVPNAVLLPLASDRLCFHKDVTGRWQIAGYIAAAR